MKIATIVIAIINEDLDQLRNCITSIDRNRFEVIIVYPTKYHVDINAVFAEMVVASRLFRKCGIHKNAV